jgi:uncharacterized protein YcbX
VGVEVGRIAQLWRFPVKSMQGAPVEALEVGAAAVVGDRGWAVADPAAGKVLSAKRWPALLLAVAAAEADGTVTITLPDGAGTLVAGEAATDEALSAYLDHEVRVIQPPPGDGMPYELPTEAWDDTSPTWEFPGPPGGPFVDLAAAHVLTTASLRTAAGLHPEGQWDVRRFRPTALVEADGDGFVEDAWVGSPLALGDEVVLSPFMPTVRCALPTRAQPGLAKDPGIATTLRDHHDLNLGVYCAVDRPGTVRVGDAVLVGGPGTA